ncbi:hypothetical protein NBRC116493_05070 [Aurantivibrio infirmus]
MKQITTPSQTIQCRQNEEAKVWYRSRRFFTINNEWFFSTRENMDIGPFESEEQARSGMQLFVDSIKQDNDYNRAENVAKNGQWAVTYYH